MATIDAIIGVLVLPVALSELDNINDRLKNIHGTATTVKYGNAYSRISEVAPKVIKIGLANKKLISPIIKLIPVVRIIACLTVSIAFSLFFNPIFLETIAVVPTPIAVKKAI